MVQLTNVHAHSASSRKDSSDLTIQLVSMIRSNEFKINVRSYFFLKLSINCSVPRIFAKVRDADRIVDDRTYCKVSFGLL